MQAYFIVHKSRVMATGEVLVGTSELARNDSIASTDDVLEIKEILSREALFAGRDGLIVTGWQRFEDPESFV